MSCFDKDRRAGIMQKPIKNDFVLRILAILSYFGYILNTDDKMWCIGLQL